MANADANTNTLIARSFHTNIVKFLREQEQVCARNFPVTEELMRRGRFMYNVSGLGFQWEVRNKQHPVSGNDGTTPINFPQHDQWLNASLPHRGFYASDSIYEKEMLENRGEEALVKVYGTMASRLKASMEEAFKSMVYRDGSSSSDKLPQGIETMLTATQSIDIDSVATGQPVANTYNAADLTAYPAGTYATLSTTLGNYGGSYRSTLVSGSFTWPMGKADTEYDFWSPIITNYTSTTIPATTHTWAGQATGAIRFTHDHLMRNNYGNPAANLCVMERTMYTDLCTLQESKERSIVTTTAPGPKQYGFGSEIFVDTLRCKADYAIDSRVAYIFNLDDLQYLSMYPTMFKVNSEPDYDMASQSYRYAAFALGNLKFSSPAKYAALKALA